MFTEANYFNAESKGIKVEVDTFGEVFKPYTDFREALTDILNAVDSCDTYCISEDFEAYGNYGGYLRLYNVNKDRTYYLYGEDVEKFMNEGYIVLYCENATEDDINDFETRY